MRTALRLIAGAIGVFALVLQYGLVAASPGAPGIVASTINFCSFFTIQTNGLVALAMLLPVVAGETAAGRFFSRSAVRTAIAGYIIIVGTVYFLLLRQLANLEGWSRLADNLLHYVTPTLFVLDWLLFVPKGQTGWRLVSRSLLFPLAFMVWTLVHGALSGWYPYPFADAGRLDYVAMLRNGVGLTLAFAAVVGALVGIDKLMARHAPSTADHTTA